MGRQVESKLPLISSAMAPTQKQINQITQPQIVRQLQALGVLPGDLLMVHASMRAVGPIEGRGTSLISALLSVVGDGGTIAAYADYELTPEVSYFDPALSPARSDYGIFPEILRTYSNSQRSRNPGASMVAVGRRAEWLCENHPLNYGYGEASPLAKVYECNGKILLLGAHLDHVTILHYAEHCAKLPNKRVVNRTNTILQEGVLTEISIEEFDTSELVCAGMPQDYFERLVRAFIQGGGANRGVVGNANSFLLPARDLVSFAIQKMEAEFGI